MFCLGFVSLSNFGKRSTHAILRTIHSFSSDNFTRRL